MHGELNFPLTTQILMKFPRELRFSSLGILSPSKPRRASIRNHLRSIFAGSTDGTSRHDFSTFCKANPTRWTTLSLGLRGVLLIAGEVMIGKATSGHSAELRNVSGRVYYRNK